jgi:hypothetical protein
MLVKAIPAAAIIVLFLVLSVNTTSHIAPSMPSSEAIELGTARAYELTQYGTYVYWNQTIYAQSVEFYSSRIAFTNATFGNQNGSSFSFGLGNEFANATIIGINSTSVIIRTSALAGGAKSSFLFFYFRPSLSPQTILFLQNSSTKTALVTRNFYTNAGSFAAASAPAAYLNATSSILTVKLDAASTILFSTVLPILTTSSASSASSFVTSSNSTTIPISTTSPSSITSTTSSSISQVSSTPEAWWIVVAMFGVTTAIIGGVLFFLRKTE